MVGADPHASDFQQYAHFLLLTIDKQIATNPETDINLDEAGEEKRSSQRVKISMRNRLLKHLCDYVDGKIQLRTVRLAYLQFNFR